MKKRFYLFLIIFSIVIYGCAEQSEEAQGSQDGDYEDDALKGGSRPVVSIGYIGCSNTRETVEGYHYMGGKKMWSYEKRYDSGSVVEWAKNAEEGNKYWDVFDELLREHPETKTIWFELCIPDSERGTSEYHTEIVLNEIRKRIPEAKIYVSALADYTGGICKITGTWGLEKAKELVKELDEKNEDVFLGPILGPMTPKDTAKDGCHLSSPDGKRKLGEQMKEFFDGQSLSGQEAETVAESIVDESKESEDIEISKDIEEEELSFEEQAWKERIEKAMEPSDCQEISKPEYPASYYQGPLIDTHLHIPAIPDWSPEDEEEAANVEAPEGRFGGPQALLGWNVRMSEIACTIMREGTHKNFAFFPVYEEIPLQLLEIWNRTMNQYPEQFTPFLMSSGNDDEPDGFPTVDAEALKEMLAVYPGLFDGYGEIGLYERENGGSPELPPDSKRLLEIYPLIRENNLAVYFHLGDGHKDNFEKILKQNPDITFIWHGDQLSVEEVKDVLRKHPNVYYGIDEFFGGEREIFEMYVGKSKEEYLETVGEKFNKVVQQAAVHWKSLIEQYPDQVLWGTDRGDAVWNYDLDVGQMQVKIARAFIGKLDPAVQEKFAYQNAEKLISLNAKKE